MGFQAKCLVDSKNLHQASLAGCWIASELHMGHLWGELLVVLSPDWMHCKPLGIDKILLGSRGIQKSLGCLLKCIRMV